MGIGGRVTLMHLEEKSRRRAASASSSKKPTKKRRKPEPEAISDALIQTICERLARNKPVRRMLPERGRLHVDRQLPFLCVYRRRRNDPGTHKFVMGEASYLIAPDGAGHRESVAELVREVVRTLAPQFGAFLLIEVWAGTAREDRNAPAVFRVVAPRSVALASTVDVLAQRLSEIRVLKRRVEVDVDHRDECSPPGLEPLLGRREAVELGCASVGLAIPPVHHNPDTGRAYPVLLRSLRRAVGQALRPTFHRFARSQTTHRPPHYHELGRRAVVKAVWQVDRELGEVSDALDFLLLATPVNSDDAWRKFKRSKFTRAPEFYYRPTPYDPPLLKRRLYRIPIARVEDPALQRLFSEKQEELDRKITMLRDRDTPRFLYGSLQLYGAVEDGLLRLARQLLRKLPSRSRDEPSKGQLDARAFAARARDECDRYREVHPDFAARTRITGSVAGIMVSRGVLLINPNTKVPRSRVDALLQHEVGTHLLTYFNGRAQPFKQLCSGFAGYEELQEGLAVLAEYLVGGLSRRRLRQLAARVVAAHNVTDGASFVEAFRILDRDYDFAQKSAFSITMRVFRGGGLTKDAVYLRGLRRILEYVNRGGKLEPLFIGKIAIDQIPIMEELQLRRVLKPAPLQPVYLDRNDVTKRLTGLRDGQPSVLALVMPQRL